MRFRERTQFPLCIARYQVDEQAWTLPKREATFGMDVNQIYLILILYRGQCVITFQPNRRLPAKIY